MKVPIKIQNKRTVLICLIFLVIVIVSNSSAANNLTINSSNADDYKNLIDNYDGTDIIFEDVEIKNFSYYFNKKVNITGKNATLNNDGTKNIFVFSQGSSGSNVENLALTKSHIAISLQNVLDFTIKNVFIENANREGMSISKSKNINLINNTIQYSTPGNNYGVGLWMTDVNNVSIINNKLNHNGRYGLQVVGGNNLTVENSTFSNNSHTFGTNVWFQSVNGLNFSGNNVTLADGGFVGSGVSVRRGTGLSLDLYNKNVNIFNNNFSDNGIHGITVGGTNKENINIYDNIINHNGRFSNLGYGININPGAIATIYNNTLANNPIGIFLNGVNSSIYNNTIMNTTISFTGSSLFDIALIDGGITIGKNALNNEIFNNSLFKNIDGIMVIGGTNNTIKNNNISDNKYNGIYSSSNETTILNNLITNNLHSGINLTSSNNLVKNNTILNNSLYGVFIEGNNNTVLSSTIVNNSVSGFNISGENNTINYNRIVNVMGLYSNGTNNNIDFNWWGINDANSQVSGNGYLLNNWYVLKITINDSTADVNTTYNVTGKKNVNVTHFFELNDETQNDKNLLPLFKITYIDDKNKSYTFGVHDVFKYSTIGNAETFLVRSLLDKEDLAMRLSFSPVTDVKTTITSNNTNPNVKDIIKIIINNSNLSPVDAENITTSIVIPDGFEYISNNNTNATYDPSTKTITWKIDKLNANANKLLEIILKAVIKGNYTINVETKTDTYDSNLSNNKAELNIKVKPESNNVSPNNNTTPNKNNNLTANAKTTNTKNTKIPLKDTGVPLIGILIVLTTIAMIFKRKN